MRIAISLLAAVVAIAACAAPRTTTTTTSIAANIPTAATTPPSQHCDSVLRRAVTDSGAGPVSVYFAAAADTTRISDAFALQLARAIAREFRPPVVTQYPMLGMHFADGRSAYYGVTGTFNVVWHSDGRLTAPSIGATTLVPALDTAMLAALGALTDAAAERQFAEGNFRDSIPLVARVYHLETPRVGVPLYRQKFARRSVTKPLRDGDGNGVHAWIRAKSPTTADTGFVTLWFVVDASGKVDPKTVQVLHRGTPGMMPALPAVVLSQPYQPTEIDGCPVATLVIRRIDFSWSP